MSKNDLFLEANQQWDAGNLATAFELFKRAATRGHASAQNSVGYFFDHGIGVRKDERKAILWYKKAAKKGDAPAMSNIAISYRDKGNLKASRAWFSKAAQKGDGDAALQLAKLYLLKASKESLMAAKRYLRLAANSKFIPQKERAKAQRLLKSVVARERKTSRQSVS